jgi:Fe-S cluster biogenesis protein NfuA
MELAAEGATKEPTGAKRSSCRAEEQGGERAGNWEEFLWKPGWTSKLVRTSIRGPLHMSDMRIAAEETVVALRPVINMDGGDIRFVDCDEENGIVTVELLGACVGCAASSMTLKAGVERIVMDRVPGVTEVRALGIDSDVPADV